MCTVQDFDLPTEDIFMEAKPVEIKKTKCLKCDESNTEIVLRSKDWYCKNCFVVAINHKFRAPLGKNRLFRNNDKVLVVYSGGLQSSALLHLLQNALNETFYKKLVIEPAVLYIDEGALLKQTTEHRKELSAKAYNEISKYNFTSYITTISYAGNTPFDQNHLGKLSDHTSFIENIDDSFILNLINNITTLTAKQDFIKTLRRRLILDVAKKLGFQYVFTSEISSDLASATLAGFASGRASHVTMDAGFSDTRDADVTILRPLRSFTVEEVTVYSDLFSLEPVILEKLGDQADVYSSVDNLMHKFISNLNINFPASVSTVIKITDKLTTIDESNVCRFCKSPLDNKITDGLSALNAVEFSRLASAQSGLKVATNNYEMPVNKLTENDNLNVFCHGCSLTFRDMKNQDVFKKNSVSQ